MSPNNSAEITELLDAWIEGEIESEAQLKSLIYHHLKGVVKQQINGQIKRQPACSAQLPNTTSFLHDALIQLVPPQECIRDSKQFYNYLALFIRRMLLDELKASHAQKRGAGVEHIKLTDLMFDEGDNHLYLRFEHALEELKSISTRCFEVALLHYFLGFNVKKIEKELTLSYRTVYRELDTAKAYIRAQLQAA